MKKLHEILAQKLTWYARWHAGARHVTYHWLVLAMVLFIATLQLFTSFRDHEIAMRAVLIESLVIKRPVQPSAGSIAGFAADHILVSFSSAANAAKRAEVLARHGLEQRSVIGGIDVVVAALKDPRNNLPVRAAERLQASETGAVEFAEADALLEAALLPDDPWFINWQQDKQKIGIPRAWDTATGTSDLIVAIADTGVDCAHEDFGSRCIAGWNFYDKTANASDVYGHGTRVAGVIAAQGNNGVGVAGGAWNVRILPLRVSDPQGYASYSAIASAITYAADHGAKVVNVSYQASGSRTIQSAGNYLRKKGGLITVSAGNTGVATANSASDDLLVVSATDPNDARYSWSSYGNDVDVAAPGCTGATTQNGGGYGSFCGTSNAAPEVAGVLLLVWSARPELTSDQVQNALFSSALDLGAGGWDVYFGWGRIDAYAVISVALQTPAASPTTQKIAPGKSRKP